MHVHGADALRDLRDVGLIDEDVLRHLPAELAERWRSL
jgi:hypothetical protein